MYHVIKMTDLVSQLQSTKDETYINQSGDQSEISTELSVSLGGKCPSNRIPVSEGVCPPTHPNYFTANDTLLSEDCCYRTTNPPQHLRTPVVWVIEKKDKTQKPFSSDFQKRVESAYQAWKMAGKGEEKRMFEYTHQNKKREIDFARKAWIKHEKDKSGNQITQTLPLLRIKRGDIRSKSLNSPKMNIKPVESDVNDAILSINNTEPELEEEISPKIVKKSLNQLEEEISPKIVTESLNQLDKTIKEMIEKQNIKKDKLTESLKILDKTVKNIIGQQAKKEESQPINEDLNISDPRKAENVTGKISASIAKDGSVNDTLYYVDRYTPKYDDFMKYINHEFAVMNGIFNKTPDKYENECIKDEQELAVTQKFIPLYLDPSSPYKGLLMYHQVGAGKTRIALHTLSNYYQMAKKHTETSAPKLIWVTSRELVKDIQERYEEFKWFWDEKEHPFSTGENQWRGEKPIYLFSYKEFTNALKGHNEFGKRFMWRKTPNKAYTVSSNTEDWENNALFDPLENTFIVFDEIHKFYEAPYSVNRLLEKSIFDSYKKSKLNGKQSVKMLLLTGTPIPTISLKHTGPPVSHTSIPLEDVPFTIFRMLNLLIDEEIKRLPSTRGQFLSVFGRDPTELDQEGIVKFKDLAKGLVSYFNPTFQYNIFAKRIKRGEIVATASESVIKRIQQECLNPKIDNPDMYGISPEKGRCLLWVSNWAGTKDYSWPPKSWKIGWKMNIEDFDYKDVLKQLPELSPKTFKLIENIKSLDKQDRKQYGKTYKHYIFSNLPPSKGSTVVNAALQANGFKYVRAPRIIKDLGLSAITTQRDMNELQIRQPTIVGNLTPQDQRSSNNFFFLQHNLHSNEKHITKLAYSDHRLNNYGQIARIIVVDKDYKEGINLMDVKYIHILEPQLSQTDEEQIVGRALRKCGHSGLEFEEWNYAVFIYDIEIPKYVLNEGEDGYVKMSDEVLKEIIDPIILQDKNVITEMIKDIAVDKYINNPRNSDAIELEITQQKVNNKSNLFKPYTSQQLNSISLHKTKLQQITQKDMDKSITQIYQEIDHDDQFIQSMRSGWENSITMENSRSTDEKLRNMFLISFFKYTPRTKFQKRYIENVYRTI